MEDADAAGRHRCGESVTGVAAGYAEPPGRDKRSIIVHHRVPGKSALKTLVSLCPACHAKVHHTKVVFSEMPPLLLELWREQHPGGHEQTRLNFNQRGPAALAVRLFADVYAENQAT